MRMTRLLLMMVVLGVACEPAPYQSPNLSSEPPPEKSAFVHFLVGSSPVPQLALSLSQKVQAVVGKREVGPRLELAAGQYPLSLDGEGLAPYTSGLLLLPGSETLLVAHVLPGLSSGRVRQGLSAYSLGLRDPKQARLRVLHLAADAPPLALAGPTGEVLLDGIAAGAVSAYSSLGTALGSDGKLLLRAPQDQRALLEVTIPDGLPLGSTSTLVALGETDPLAEAADAFGLLAFDEASGTVRQLPIEPAPGAPEGQIYLFHASSELPGVSAKTTSGTLWGPVAYQSGTPLAALAAGLHTLSLSESGLALWNGTLRLWPGRQWLLLLHGTRKLPRLLALPRPERAPQTVWRVVNLVEGLESCYLLDGDDAMVSALSYGTATAPKLGELKRRTLRLRDGQSSGLSWDIEFDATAAGWAQDQVVTLVLSGDVASKSSVTAQLLVESRAASTMAVPALVLATTPTL